MRLRVLVAFAFCGVMACSGSHEITTNPDQCFIVLMTISPGAPRLAVGDTVTLHGLISDVPHCLPPGVTSATPVHWQNQNPSIVSVDSITGLVTALAPGDAEVIGGPAGFSIPPWGLGAVDIAVTARAR